MCAYITANTPIYSQEVCREVNDNKNQKESFVSTISAFPLISSGLNETCFLQNYKRKFKISSKTLQKYNTKKVWALAFNEENLKQLQQNYHKLKIPKFIERFLNFDENFLDVKIYKQYPMLHKWNADKTFLLQINTPRLMNGFEKLLSKPEKMKSMECGFSLVGYYYHPKLAKNFRINSKNSNLIQNKISDLTYEEIENLDAPYLVSPLDLNRSHIPYLENLKSMICTHLQNTYKVTSKDTVEIYFHFPYALETASLHLHVRVNEAHLKLEKSRMYYLDDILFALNNNQSLIDLVVKRMVSYNGHAYVEAQHNNIDCESDENFCNPDHYKPFSLIQAFDGIQNIPCKLVDNPFKKNFLSERLVG